MNEKFPRIARSPTLFSLSPNGIWRTTQQFNVCSREREKSSFMFIYVDTAESIIALLLTIIVIVIGRMMRMALAGAKF